MTVLDTIHDLPMIWILRPNSVVVFDRMESSDNSVWLMPLSDASFKRASRTKNVVLELNWMTGTRRVFSRIAFSHLFEFGFKGTKLIVIEVRPAVSLVASFISEFVIPWVLLVTMLSIAVNHCSVSGSLKDKILFLLYMNAISCFKISALW